MNRSKFYYFLFFVFTFTISSAQDDLLKELDVDSTKTKEKVVSAFKGLQICNMQSTKLTAKGEWYMLVSHRFGDVTEGFDNFFGLDNANTKIGGIYGVTDWLSIGFSRHTLNKVYEVTTKYKLANQLVGDFPVTIVGYNTIDVNSKLEKEFLPGLQFRNRLAFSTQLLISRKFSDLFSLEINPVYIHKNLYEYGLEQKNEFFIGTGARYKISKRMSVNLEYAARITTVEGAVSPYENPLTLGLDIETGGHVFQLVLSNSQAMNDVDIFSRPAGDWFGGAIYFGFNLYRVF
jgi:hypothetical protein